MSSVRCHTYSDAVLSTHCEAMEEEADALSGLLNNC